MAVTNGCARCKAYPYVPPGEVEPRSGAEPPIVIWWYCIDCVKKCKICRVWRSLYQFNPLRHTEAFKEWRSTSAINQYDMDIVHGGDKIGVGDELGILKGPHLFEDACIHCQPFRPPVVEWAIKRTVQPAATTFNSALAELQEELRRNKR